MGFHAAHSDCEAHALYNGWKYFDQILLLLMMLTTLWWLIFVRGALVKHNETEIRLTGENSRDTTGFSVPFSYIPVLRNSDTASETASERFTHGAEGKGKGKGIAERLNHSNLETVLNANTTAVRQNHERTHSIQNQSPQHQQEEGQINERRRFKTKKMRREQVQSVDEMPSFLLESSHQKGSKTVFDPRMKKRLSDSRRASLDRYKARSQHGVGLEKERLLDVHGNEVRRKGNLCSKNNQVMAQVMEVETMFFTRRCGSVQYEIEFEYKGESFGVKDSP